MKHFRQIIMSNTPPTIDSLWLKGDTLKFFGNKGWQTISEVKASDLEKLKTEVVSLEVFNSFKTTQEELNKKLTEDINKLNKELIALTNRVNKLEQIKPEAK